MAETLQQRYDSLRGAFRELRDLVEERMSLAEANGDRRNVGDLRELFDNRRLSWRAFDQ